MTRLGVIFGIVFDLFALSISKTDDSTNFPAIYKGNVIKIVGFRYESDHSDLVVFISFVDPDECLIPNQTFCELQRQAVLSAVQSVFGRVKFDEHTIL